MAKLRNNNFRKKNDLVTAKHICEFMNYDNANCYLYSKQYSYSKHNCTCINRIMNITDEYVSYAVKNTWLLWSIISCPA